MNTKCFLWSLVISSFLSCQSSRDPLAAYNSYPVKNGDLTEMVYSPKHTDFFLWAPTAKAVKLQIYASATDEKPRRIVMMHRAKEGGWEQQVEGDLKGLFYTFKVKTDRQWLEETPGIMAKAVGVNGHRGAIIDLKETNPEGWESDVRPPLRSFADIIVYEMHHRDFSLDSLSGIRHRGKFLALTESGTRTADGLASGLDHLRELGVTHVHLLPSYDFASVDESRPDSAQYNWGYDPLNYNVPDGSYATDAVTPETRIREFKEMVMALHKAGLRVILDVVYNHTYDLAGSNFERTAPGYFYRHRADGSIADGSGCGNETASERPEMREYMKQSVLYWLREYHLDGFRFDLMGIHDLQTMQEIREAVSAVDPTVFIYGEGWAAQAPQLPEEELAMKANIHRLPGIAAFSDELRDALRGGWNDDTKGAFLIGEGGHEMSLKFGLVGAIQHPQVDNTLVNYSKAPWADQPTQMISYVSCHDDMCLADRLKATLPGSSEAERIALHKLAETVVLTSQGVPFLFAGDELMRDKKGVHNSFQSPDSINTIPWHNKAVYNDLYQYIRGLIALRKAHPVFRLGDADAVRELMEFLPVEGEKLVAFRLKGTAAGDDWAETYVVFNSRPTEAEVELPKGDYTIVCREGKINLDGLGTFRGTTLKVPAQSAEIVYR